MRAPETCPNCGTDVPPNARACPGCGSDESTGWSEHAHTQSLDLPGEEFDYDEFVGREFGGKERRPGGLHWIWWVTALVLLGAFVAFWFFR